MNKFTSKISGTLFDALKNNFPEMSNQKLRNMIKHSLVKRNGVTIKQANEPVNMGDELVFISKQEPKTVKEKGKTIKIVYEDEWLLVVHKPAGMLTSGESSPNSPTMVKILTDYLREKETSAGRLQIVHRLDREVEGLIIFAKSEAINEALKQNWKGVEKNYLALVEKRPQSDTGEISSWLKDGLKQKVFSYDREIPDSKWAVTHFRYIKTVGKYHLLEVSLETGRKNQIRVHLAEIGCPVVGDFKYGADNTVLRQIRLIAWRIAFEHPVTHKRVELEATIPAKFYTPSETVTEKYK